MVMAYIDDIVIATETTLHTGTGLVEQTIQSLKNLVLANVEDDQNVGESVNRALYVLRFTIQSETKINLF